MPDPSRNKSGLQGRATLLQAGENTQWKGSIRRSLVLEPFPRQPQFGFTQAISSLANIFIASSSDSDAFEHLRCKLMLCLLLGRSNTTWQALLMSYYSTDRLSAL